MIVEQKSKWACINCKGNSSSFSRANSNVSSLNDEAVLEDVSIKALLTRMNSRLDTLDVVETSVAEMKTSLEFISEKFDNFLVEVRGYNETTKKLKIEVHELKASCAEKDKVLKALSRRFNTIEQYGRGNNLEIHGLDDTNVGHDDTNSIIAFGLAYNPTSVGPPQPPTECRLAIRKSLFNL